MPPTHTDEGLRAAHRIRAERPRTGVLVLSQYLDEDYVFQLLGDGAQGLGYLLKDRITDGDAFVDAVHRVAAGDAALDPEVVAHLLGSRAAGGPLDELNDRERTVLGEMAEGRSNHGDRPAAVPLRPRRRAPRHRDLLQAPAGRDAGLAPPRAGGDHLPARVTPRAGARGVRAPPNGGGLPAAAEAWDLLRPAAAAAARSGSCSGRSPSLTVSVFLEPSRVTLTSTESPGLCSSTSEVSVLRVLDRLAAERGDDVAGLQAARRRPGRRSSAARSARRRRLGGLRLDAEVGVADLAGRHAAARSRS